MRRTIEEIRRIHSAISKLIAEEPRDLPLTDAELAKRLQAYSVNANQIWYYRRDLRIPNSKMRKKKYKGEKE